MEIHFALAHFPIALLITGGAWLALALVTADQGARKTIALGLLSAGAVLSVPTVAAGLLIAAAHQSHHAQSLEIHRVVGIATMVVALLGLGSHWLRRKIANADVVRNVFFLAAALLAGITGTLGAEMAHGDQSQSRSEHAPTVQESESTHEQSNPQNHHEKHDH